jgi:transcription factor 1
MEPEMLYYEPFVKPLLEKPGSTYRHTTLVGAHPREYWDNYKQIFDDKDLVGRPTLPLDDPKLREIDTSILLTGNLWRRYAVAHRSGNVDHSTLLLQQMTYTALTNDIFQRSGLVRQLWWAPDELKRGIFPSSIRGKRSYDLGLTMGASVTEVAGISRVESLRRAAFAESPRAAGMDAAVLGRVEQRMAEKGQVIPPNRKMPTVVDAIKPEDDVHATNSIMKTSCTTIDELKAAIEKFDAWCVTLQEVMVKRHFGPAVRVPARDESPEGIAGFLEQVVRYKQVIDLVESRRPFTHDFIGSIVGYVRFVVVMDLEARMVNLEAEYAAVRDTNPDPDALAACRDSIFSSTKALAQLIKKYAGDRKQMFIQVLLGDLISGECQPPTLHRDRRPYEPLQAQPDEFWPQYDLALLDIVPETRDLSAPGIADRREGTKVCQELLKHLYNSPSIPVPIALDRIAPNAAQDLIPEVPDLTDVRRGGRLDVNQMPVRMLTPEMVEALVKAFMEWPFRPSAVEMALSQDPGFAQEDDEMDGQIE